MKATIIVNGQKAPIGVNTKEVRLELVTEGVSDVEQVVYSIYTQGNYKTPVYYACADLSPVYVDADKLQDCTEYRCEAEIHYENGKHMKVRTNFETGLSDEHFSAKWIENPMLTDYVSEYVQTFNLTEAIDKARLYIVGLGFYQTEINGQRTDSDFYKPLLTDFDVRTGLDNVDYDEEGFKDGDKTICYDTLDVTELLQQGENRLSVLVGPGWYCNTDKTVTDMSYSFGTPKLLFELHLYSKGERYIIASGKECMVRNTTMKSQLYNGDFVDFTKTPTEFVPANICVAPKGRLLPSETTFDRIREKISLRNMRQYEEVEEYVLGEDGSPQKVACQRQVIECDFGKVHTGGLHLKVKGKRGSRLILRFYEAKTDGVLNPLTSSCGLYDRTMHKYIGAISQRSEYILSGEEDEIYPLFHWDCYRYVTMEFSEDEAEISYIKSLFICSDIKKNAKFHCSESFFNKLYDAFVLTQLDNMHCGVPSDCPHREKLPYTGDGQLATEATLYCLESEQFYRKWLKDIIAAQRKDGWIPYTAPYIAGGGGSWWSNALTVVPLQLYRHTGDKTILESALPAILRLLDFYMYSSEEGVMTKRPITWFLGEWVTPDYTEVSIPYMNTLAHYTALCQAIEICEVLEQRDTAEELSQRKERIRNAVNEAFFNDEQLDYCKGVQGENVLPAINGIVPDEMQEALWEKVVKHYQDNPRFDTGIILTPILLDALMERGEKDLAYNILTGRQEPSYRDMLKGATTLREHFRLRHRNRDGLDGSFVSHCHPMFGSVIPWVVKHVAGLDLTQIGVGKILIAPKYMDRVKKVSAHKDTKYGKVSVHYSIEEAFEMRIQIPFGCVAEVVLPEECMKQAECICDTTSQNIEFSLENSKYKATLTGGTYRIKTRG